MITSKPFKLLRVETQSPDRRVDHCWLRSDQLLCLTVNLVDQTFCFSPCFQSINLPLRQMSHKSTMSWKEPTVNIGTWLLGASFGKSKSKLFQRHLLGQEDTGWLSTTACLWPISNNFLSLLLLLIRLRKCYQACPTSTLTLFKLQHPH